MILRLQEAQNDYRSSFVSLVCRYRRCLRRESLRMATGCALRALHQAERLEEVGSAPAIRPRCAGLHVARRYQSDRVTKRARGPSGELTVTLRSRPCMAAARRST